MITFLLLSAGALMAQNISVKSFQSLPMDMTATSVVDKRVDQNGKAAALIKIVTPETGFTFEGGTLGIVDSKQQIGEVWVWVPQGLRKITIRHHKYGVLNNFYFPLDLESERTYEMILLVAKEGESLDQMKRGAVSVKSNVPATFYIDDKLIGATPMYYADLTLGEHTVRIVAEGYSDYTETIQVEEDDLVQVKGILETEQGVVFKCNVPDANLYFDGKKVGKAQGKYNMKLGEYAVRATSPSHEDYHGTITVDKTTHSYSLYLISVERITVNGVTFNMKKIDGGSFVMGGNDEHAEFYEKPTHTVTLDGFYMGETEVTQALWKAVMGNNPSYFIGDNLPVQNVTWSDCLRFIKKLNELTKRKFRLPTEAEWEYAARGGTTTSLYSGEDIKVISNNNAPNLDLLAWYPGNCGRNYTIAEGCDVGRGIDLTTVPDKQYADQLGGVHPVGKKAPNAYGLYDMLGNVAEWCNDYCEQYSAASQSNPNQTTPKRTMSTIPVYVVRGGAINFNAQSLRVSARSYSSDEGQAFLGFRIAMDQQ